MVAIVPLLYLSVGCLGDESGASAHIDSLSGYAAERLLPKHLFEAHDDALQFEFGGVVANPAELSTSPSLEGDTKLPSANHER